ncbi:hypothetical protein PAPYR_8220 [Paratrimastix pyriformis]|uniref:Uncharacterized protein n=1 Tax=Paratrimastix pyriformis TaxID=342808 RepID=A0ABQ8UB14_9EUKA|nr:hypothetical protein PAPYR_8220 [Paratrimastix pyriformis]
MELAWDIEMVDSSLRACDWRSETVGGVDGTRGGGDMRDLPPAVVRRVQIPHLLDHRKVSDEHFEGETSRLVMRPLSEQASCGAWGIRDAISRW